MLFAIRFLVRLATTAIAFSAGADDAAIRAIERASTAQANALNTLQQHHEFEKELVKRESDRLTIFFSTRQADNLNLAEMILTIDGHPVASHRYSPEQQRGLRGRVVQLVHSGYIGPGLHEIQFSLRLDTGVLIAMTPYKFVKGPNDKFLEIQLTGGAARSFAVLAW